MTEGLEIRPYLRQKIDLFYFVNIMEAGVQATQGANASTTKILIMLSLNDSARPC